MAISIKLTDRIEEFVDEFVIKYPIPKVRDQKVIHDPLWGTQLLAKYEIALLDTPLIQRLRQIHQTAFTFLTYPSATHTRFEHTLGVMYQCEKLAHVLEKKHPDLFNPTLMREIRIASLLHDCGHGPLSHSSEEIYRFFPEIEELIKKGGDFEHKSPHEILSYLIVMSKKFSKFFDNIKGDYDFDADLQKIADMIIGRPKDDLSMYQVEILNGPFDADKLDYIFRDGHFSGLNLSVDLDRLWHAADIDKYMGKRRLTIAHNGVISLEQILFCKINLFASIYHHHKVRACDCMLKGIVEYCKKNKLEICGKNFESAVDFLWLTDEKIFSEADNKNCDKKLHKLIHDLFYRRLLKRALVISKSTVINPGKSKYLKFRALTLKYMDLRKLAEEIWEDAKKPCLLEEVWVDLPKSPKAKEADDTLVKKPGNIFEPINEFFPLDRWVLQYSEHKWKGHVFCPPEEETRKKINKSAKRILGKKYGIKFSDLASTLCHL